MLSRLRLGVGKFWEQGGLDVKGQIYQNDGKLVLDVSNVATTTAKGIAELATSAETLAGTDTGRVVTPAGFKSGLAPLESRELAGLRPVKPTSVSLNAGTASIGSDGIVTVTNANGIVLNGITRVGGTGRYKVFCRLTSAIGDYFFARFAIAGSSVAGALYQGGTNYRQGTTGTMGNFQSLNDSTYMVAGYISASYSDLEIDFNSVNTQWPSLGTVGSYGMGINHTNIWGHWVYTDTVARTRDGLWLSMNGSGLVTGTIEVYEYVR